MDPRHARRARRDAVARRAAERDAAGRNRPALARWRRFRRRVGDVLVAALAPFVLRLLACTWRVERRGDAGFALLRSDAPWLVAMWHGRMLCLMPLRWHRGRGIDVLVSPSDDGSLATNALRRFGYGAIRGSLSRRGAGAMRAMAATLRAGGRVVITPDGPRGPRHTLHTGVPWLAHATGAPILPVGVAVDRAWRLRSWDRFTIPKPFARLIVHYGDPIPVAAASDEAALERHGEELRRRLLAAERDGFARLGVADDHELAPEQDDPGPTRVEPGS